MTWHGALYADVGRPPRRLEALYSGHRKAFFRPLRGAMAGHGVGGASEVLLQMKLQSMILLSICSVQIVAFLGKPVVTNGHSMVTALVLCARLSVSLHGGNTE